MDARFFKDDDMPNSHPMNNLFKYSHQLTQVKDALHISKVERFSKLNKTVGVELGFDMVSNSTAMYSELL